VRNRNFESISLQRGVRCELNLGEAALPMTSRRVLLIGTGFQEVRVERQWREGSFDSFDEYWDMAYHHTNSFWSLSATHPACGCARGGRVFWARRLWFLDADEVELRTWRPDD